MMFSVSLWGEPRLQYSSDGGKTWRNDGPFIGPDAAVRVITVDGQVIYFARSVSQTVRCEGCDGSGKVTRYKFEKADQ